MDLDLHQLGLRYEGLRSRRPLAEARLLTSLEEHGQQAPIVVVRDGGKHVVVDGNKRVRAMRRLKRDTVGALLWELPPDDALVVHRLTATSVLGRPPRMRRVGPEGDHRLTSHGVPALEGVTHPGVRPRQRSAGQNRAPIGVGTVTHQGHRRGRHDVGLLHGMRDHRLGRDGDDLHVSLADRLSVLRGSRKPTRPGPPVSVATRPNSSSAAAAPRPRVRGPTSE